MSFGKRAAINIGMCMKGKIKDRSNGQTRTEAATNGQEKIEGQPGAAKITEARAETTKTDRDSKSAEPS